jgi:hypothetical protein
MSVVYKLYSITAAQHYSISTVSNLYMYTAPPGLPLRDACLVALGAKIRGTYKMFHMSLRNAAPPPLRRVSVRLYLSVLASKQASKQARKEARKQVLAGLACLLVGAMASVVFYLKSKNSRKIL